MNEGNVRGTLAVRGIVWCVLFFLCASCGRERMSIVGDGPVVCFGDSITAGEGAGEGEDYPSVLQGMLGRPVVNAGVSGDTTRDGLARFEKDVRARSPAVVIIEFGGNDRAAGIPARETVDNIERMVTETKLTGALPVVMEVRVPPVVDIGRELSRVARAHQAPFVPHILRGILSDSSLRADVIHPNAAGYRIIARRVAAVLRPLLE